VDVLSDLLQRAQATDALVRQIIARGPWSVTYADVPSYRSSRRSVAVRACGWTTAYRRCWLPMTSR
jgi:hypothetical protein